MDHLSTKRCKAQGNDNDTYFLFIKTRRHAYENDARKDPK